MNTKYAYFIGFRLLFIAMKCIALAQLHSNILIIFYIVSIENVNQKGIHKDTGRHE